MNISSHQGFFFLRSRKAMSRSPLSRNSAESDESSLMRFLRHKKLLDKSNLTEEERVKAKLKGRRRRHEGTENYIYREGFCRRWEKIDKG
ncbi:hypothetical protein CDAR_608701 [Caerostris darwini]|uniref:Uncharacterized protein n=1 Tax=Caerostris darwini TaxID=1538125 RepID=A0AAV4WJ22_9ARAC|nr:hypothetical protein CDAR_608701 [Caerostris darwini]